MPEGHGLDVPAPEPFRGGLLPPGEPSSRSPLHPHESPDLADT